MSSGALLACTGCLSSCAPDYLDPAPTNIDFTLDLNLPENVSLKTIGGSVVNEGVIVARIALNEFTAISQRCTHEPVAVAFQSADQTFLCPRHPSKFTKDGVVLNGPATKPLRKYNTTVTVISVRVFS